ncbi:flagellar biosynthetic protein FliR [Microbulbifer sediminum]|uniref:flagellar biosynthetic protein FliR n=1 Tax=Microbulbifer sediminum TaxID=2904250 RepID=UPI001F1C82BF|nr:flagellar biosynthetic protein FliR [Microbulbifer sediminum]
MSLQFSSEWLLSVLLVATRLSPLVFFSPLFSLAKVPARISVLLIVITAVGISPLVKTAAIGGIGTALELAVFVMEEVVIGLLMAFGVFAAFAVFSFGGRLLDMQMGFGVAAAVDPASGAQSPLLGTAILSTAVLVFFLADYHHAFLKAFIYSFSSIPLGGGIAGIGGNAVISQFGLMFTLGVVLVLPVVVVLLFLDICMALAARSMPQINMFMLSIPIKVLVGLILLAMLAATFGNIFTQAFESIFSYWGALT